MAGVQLLLTEYVDPAALSGGDMKFCPSMGIYHIISFCVQVDEVKCKLQNIFQLVF